MYVIRASDQNLLQISMGRISKTDIRPGRGIDQRAEDRRHVS
jgi:hypothetical protein